MSELHHRPCSGMVRVKEIHSVTYRPYTFIRNGVSRTWKFTSTIFNQQSPTDLLLATKFTDPGGMDGFVDRLPQDSNLGPPTLVP